MIIGPKHYVPVLKVKTNEKLALQNLDDTLCRKVIPLLDVVERVPPKGKSKGKSIQQHLDTTFKNLAESTSRFPRCLIDTREIAPDGSAAALEVFQRALSAGIVFTPVTGISRTVDVDAATSFRTNGIGLRLTIQDLESGKLPQKLLRFLTSYNLTHKEIDIILDIGAADSMVSEGIGEVTNAFLRTVPDLTKWRSLIVSACAFPKSLGIIKGNSAGTVERSGWVSWCENLFANRKTLSRLPTFSDFGIQHPSGVEGVDFTMMQGSAAIRYALSRDWLLIKGSGTKKKKSTLQYPILASQLTKGIYRSYFKGPQHCLGCLGALACANGAPRFGSTGKWRYLGTVHHITTALEELASLPWP
jgi:hypothetical protein